MSNERFRILPNSEVDELGLYHGGDPDYGSCIVEFPPDEEPRVVGQDGGEPEDQCLGRDWKWVVYALNEAYKRGHEDGVAAANFENGG